MVANLHFQFSSENQIILLYLPPVRYHSFFTNLPPISIQPPRVMRGMIACIPLYVNLTSTQGCIRGLAHACVCVEASKEEGDVRGRMCARWRVWWRWERGRKNFEPLFLKLTSPPGCMMGKREVGTKGACGKIDSFRVGLLLLPFLINSRSFFYYTWMALQTCITYAWCLVFAYLVCLSYFPRVLFVKWQTVFELRVKELVVYMCR